MLNKRVASDQRIIVKTNEHCVGFGFASCNIITNMMPDSAPSENAG